LDFDSIFKGIGAHPGVIDLPAFACEVQLCGINFSNEWLISFCKELPELSFVLSTSARKTAQRFYGKFASRIGFRIRYRQAEFSAISLLAVPWEVVRDEHPF
jgi:hypothetical protein